ncbi:MAG: di-trans,poly-cis-decaprenylcistransferase [Chloroflexi bacterium]|nr:di-trans,poly-cis-decaprenylcistransferase [Chloroflexota bacterium]
MATQTRTEARPAPQPGSVPRHVAIIMDGNGRWAQQRGLPRLAGHRAGTRTLRSVVETFSNRGVPYVTLYAFSTENWSRPKNEVQGLWRLLAEVIRRELPELHKNGVRLIHLGRRDRLNPKLMKAIDHAVDVTKDNRKLTLSVALDYGGRAEIIQAVQRLMHEGVQADAITDDAIASRLYTAGMPDPDLVIRTGGEMRLSNYLLWQTAYAEYYATEKCWPDFDAAEVDRALEAYAQRQRRFGGLKSGA